MSDALRRSNLVVFVCVCAFALMPNVVGQECKECSKGKVNMPITLAVGTVRTPVFTSKGDLYLIAIEFHGRSVNYKELQCKVGSYEPGLTQECKAQSLIEARWRVLEGNSEIAHGEVDGFSKNFDFAGHFIRRYIGEFQCEPNHKYVVEVTFTKDGSSLNFANPHLVVMQPEWSF